MERKGERRKGYGRRRESRKGRKEGSGGKGKLHSAIVSAVTVGGLFLWPALRYRTGYQSDRPGHHQRLLQTFTEDVFIFSLLVYIAHYSFQDDALYKFTYLLTYLLYLLIFTPVGLTHTNNHPLIRSIMPNSNELICRLIRFIFTARLHGMQTRSCDENSVRPSVRLSVRQTHGL